LALPYVRSSEVYPDAKFDPLFLGYVGISLCHAALDFDRTALRVHHAAELRKHPIASVLDDPTAIFGDFGIDEDAQMFL
jgi:hypothetical protein